MSKKKEECETIKPGRQYNFILSIWMEYGIQSNLSHRNDNILSSFYLEQILHEILETITNITI